MEDFIIVGSDGTEHHFPEGMDPQRAIQVVKSAELSSANAKPLKEPTSYEEGFRQSLAKTARDTGSGILKGVTSMFSREPNKTWEQQDAEMRANPPRFDPAGAGRKIISGLKNTAQSLTTPEGGGEAIGNLLTLGATNRIGDLASKVPTTKGDMGRALKTVGDFDLTKPLKAVSKVGDRMVKSAEHEAPAGVDRYKPNVSSSPDQGIPPGNLPVGNTVDLESALDTLLRKSAAGSSETTQTDRVPYGGVEVPHKVRRPRMATEVSNPFGTDTPVTETRHSELLKKFGGTPPEQVGDRPVPLEPAESASSVESGAASIPDTKPKLSAEEVAQLGRRTYGSRDAGAMLYGDSLSPAERAAAIKRLAPGPSRIPSVAEARINGQPRDLSLEEALAELIKARGVE